MRLTRSAVLSGLVLLALVAIGLAAFSPSSSPGAATDDSVAPIDAWSGRAAAAVFAAQPQPQPAARSIVADDLEATDVEALASAFTTTTSTTTTTTEATTTTSAPAPTTTKAATTTTAPTTTTTTTTTTTPPTTTTAPPPGDNPYCCMADVERWRGLVATYFPASNVEDALRVIDCESNGDPNVVNPNSGAAGLFQFIPSTWANISPMAGWAGADVLDPTANVAIAAWLSNYTTENGQGPWQQWHCKP